MKKIRYDYRKQYPENIKALERDKYKCVECGSSDSIIVHHIDKSRKMGIKKMNRSLDNLMTLCKICHAKIHGYTLRFSDPKISLILELRKNKKTFKEIANYLGISRQRVHQIYKKYI